MSTVLETAPAREGSPPGLITAPATWAARVALGAAGCCLYVTAPLVVGWLARRSRRAAGVDGGSPGWPHLRAIWGDYVVGCRVAFGGFLLLAPALLLMTAAWEFGWLNSFHKGYERSAAGAVTFMAAVAWFAATMLYVPVAQAHCAATGELRAFLDFRTVGRVVRRKWRANLLMALTAGLLSVPLFVMKAAPRFFEQIHPWFETAGDAELLRFMWRYTFIQGAVLFVSLWILRGWAGRVYARGLTAADSRRPALRRAGHGLTLLIWVGVAIGVLVGEFWNYEPVVGFLNRPMFVLPCVNFIPAGLTG